MPNWCLNNVKLTHDDVELVDGLYQILEKNPDDQGIFQYLRPRPESESENWYSWNLENWGCKWDISSHDYEREDNNTIRMSFDSPWGPPIAIYEFLESEGWSIDAMYDEGGMAFCGAFRDGYNDHYDYSDMSADEIDDQIPRDINDTYGIAEQKRSWEEENEEFEDEEESDEPEYEMTQWFSKKINPSYEGIYEVITKSWPFPHKAYFDGEDWRSFFGNPEDLGDIIKIKEWRGLAEKPQTEEELDAELQKALEELKLEFEKQLED
jgi:hypothetical protein